jgi:hypothetical protein
MSAPKNDPLVTGNEHGDSFQARCPKTDGAQSTPAKRKRLSFLGELPSDAGQFVIQSNAGRMAPSRNDHVSINPEQQVLERLRQAVKGYQSTASYCCGGSIPISTSTSSERPSPTSSKGENPINAPPVSFRWDISGHGIARTIHFPFKETETSTLRKSTLFDELLQSCAPATFGRNDKDILDESYRKAGKLDRNQFSVDFHPHDYGIVDAISQILLPEISNEFLKDREEHRGVVAELYKLNVSQ